MLHFAYAEVEETRKNYQAARNTYNALITTLGHQLEKLQKSIDSEVSLAQGPPISLTNPDSDPSSDFRKQTEEREERGRRVRERREKELEDLKGALGVVWIMVMRFERRSEGVKAFRDVFLEARKNVWTVWTVWEAAGACFSLCVIGRGADGWVGGKR